MTKHQKLVYDLTLTGLSNKEIGTNLNITEKTVKFHLTNIYKLMNVKNRKQLLVSGLTTVA